MTKSRRMCDACRVCRRHNVRVPKFVENPKGRDHLKENLQCSSVINVYRGLIVKCPVDLNPSLKFLFIIFLKTAFANVYLFDISGWSVLMPIIMIWADRHGQLHYGKGNFCFVDMNEMFIR